MKSDANVWADPILPRTDRELRVREVGMTFDNDLVISLEDAWGTFRVDIPRKNLIRLAKEAARSTSYERQRARKKA